MLLSALELDTMNIPVDIRQLILQFEDVFPTELPSDLPPMRDIQHCIDLVPCESLPNRPAYIITPLEKEEIQKQVGELLAKRYPLFCPNPSYSQKGWLLENVCK